MNNFHYDKTTRMLSIGSIGMAVKVPPSAGGIENEYDVVMDCMDKMMGQVLAQKKELMAERVFLKSDQKLMHTLRDENAEMREQLAKWTNVFS